MSVFSNTVAEPSAFSFAKSMGSFVLVWKWVCVEYVQVVSYLPDLKPGMFDFK